MALSLSGNGAESARPAAAAAHSTAESGPAGGPVPTAGSEGASVAFDCSTSQVQGLTGLDDALHRADLELLESDQFRNTMQRVVWGMARYMLFTGCAARKDLRDAKLQEVITGLLGRSSSDRRLKTAAKRIAIAQAQRILSHVFGLGLDRVPRPAVVDHAGGSAPAASKKAQAPLMVINTLFSPLVRRAIMQRRDPSKSALLMLMLAVIKLEGDAVERDRMWERLSAMGTPSVVTETGRSHGPFDDLHLALKEFTDARYIGHYVVRGASANEPRRTVLTIGPRAVAEIGHPAIVEFVLQVMDPRQRSAAFHGSPDPEAAAAAGVTGHAAEQWRKKTEKWRQEALTRQQTELGREDVLRRPVVAQSQLPGTGGEWTTQRSSASASASAAGAARPGGATASSPASGGVAELPGDGSSSPASGGPATRTVQQRRSRRYGGENGPPADVKRQRR